MPNRLAHETSPYLRQHAGNPVDWHPWGEEALALARERDLPILLSVGYSACHWCHVMAHESFEDAEVAAEMNRLYINIKVDREERPDLDHIYQLAHHLLTRRNGGWPLTLFLTPDGTPFFGGTYFPKTARYQMPGFKDLLPRIAEAYRSQRGEIVKQGESLRAALDSMAPGGEGGSDTAPAERAPLAAALADFARLFDRRHGGIGGAPKFPHPHELAFCLRCYAREGDAVALDIARVTLSQMAEGGIYDHLGGGFARYSVDESWTIPHFEKMLYDNGPLLALYTDGWQVTRDARYRSVVAETAAWAMREMQSPSGGYYASFDADSEHEEGKFYVWMPREVEALLTAEEYAVVASHYGLNEMPNFEGRYWHLRVSLPLSEVALTLGLTAAEAETRLAAARAKLLAARATRIWPGRDDKILTSWNALMIRGMARAARVFGEAAWLASARQALDFIRDTMWRDGRLLATFKDGRAHLNAYLDDHAFLLDALLELLQAGFRDMDLRFAQALADSLLERFEDRAHGGFFFTSHDHEKLIHRAKSAYDNATPSGNGVAAFALQRLGHIVGEPRYLDAAARALHVFRHTLTTQPSACVSLLTALEESLSPPSLVVLRAAEGAANGAALAAWQRALTQHYRPGVMVVALPAYAENLPAALDKPAPAAGVNGWVCTALSCLPPMDDLGTIEEALPKPPPQSGEAAAR